MIRSDLPDGRGWAPSWAALLLGLPALAIVVLAVAAVALLGWTDLYADQWRLYPLHLDTPFPLDVLIHDNGHRQVLPSLVRLAELALGLQEQQLQLLSGTLAALVALALVIRCAWRDPRLEPTTRWAALAMTAFALFWLGNARILLSGYETPSDYFLTALVVAALLQVAGPGPAPCRRLVAAALFGALAAFCYGSGMAGLVAVVLVLVLQRDYRGAGWLVLAAVATAALYLLLPAANEHRGGLLIRPLENLLTAATWLGSLWVNLFAAALDPEAGNSLPPGLRRLTQWLAHGYTGAFGSPWRHSRPFAVPTLAALAWLAWASWRLWRHDDAGRTRTLGIGLAWFTFGMALIVSMGRLDYFPQHPGQIFANRYLLWSCLFWLGVVLAALGGAGPWRWPLVRVALPVAVVAVVLAAGLATSPGHWIWGGLVQQGISLTSAGVAAGVVEADRSLGETVFSEVAASEPGLRAHAISMFAWPETRLQGRPVEGIDGSTEVSAGLQVREVGNRLRGGRALRLELQAQRHADVAMPERLLALSDGIAVGVLVRQPMEPGWRYAGYASAPAGAALAVGPLGDDRRLRCWTGCGASATGTD